MKKTYINPETIVVALNVRDNVLQAGSVKDVQGLTGFKRGADTGSETITEAEGREIINTNVWEEW